MIFGTVDRKAICDSSSLIILQTRRFELVEDKRLKLYTEKFSSRPLQGGLTGSYVYWLQLCHDQELRLVCIRSVCSLSKSLNGLAVSAEHYSNQQIFLPNSFLMKLLEDTVFKCKNAVLNENASLVLCNQGPRLWSAKLSRSRQVRDLIINNFNVWDAMIIIK